MSTMTAVRTRFAPRAAAPAVYVVTMATGPIVGPGAIDGLRRMPIREACDVANLAVRAMRHPRIVHADTLAVVAIY